VSVVTGAGWLADSRAPRGRDLVLAAMALVALVGAVVMAVVTVPYLNVRSVRRRWQIRIAEGRSERPAYGHKLLG
jgi:hypothetical protein